MALQSRRPVGRRRCEVSRLPMMTVSRLLKSCATPPVSWPIASIFCDWRNASSICGPAGHFLGDALFEVFVQRPQLALGGSERPFRPVALGDVAKRDQGALHLPVLDQRGSVDRQHDPAIVGRVRTFRSRFRSPVRRPGRRAPGNCRADSASPVRGSEHPRHVLVSPPFQLGAPGVQYPLRRRVHIKKLAARG